MTENNKHIFIIAGAIIVAGLIIAFGVWAGLSQNPATTETSGVTNSPGQAATDQAKDSSEQVTLTGLAVSLGIDKEKLAQCKSSGRFIDDIRSSKRGGMKAGVNGTPGSFLVVKNKGWEFPVMGALPPQVISQFIGTILSGLETGLSYDQIAEKIYPIGNQKAPKGPQAVKLPPITEADYLRGSQSATVTLVEYTDLQCPFCFRFHSSVQQVMNQYGSQELAWVYRPFPLTSIHPKAMEAAVTAECVGMLKKDTAVWKFIDKVFANYAALYRH